MHIYCVYLYLCIPDNITVFIFSRPRGIRYHLNIFMRTLPVEKSKLFSHKRLIGGLSSMP